MVPCRDEHRGKSQPVADSHPQAKAEGKGIPVAGVCSFSRSIAGIENTAEGTCSGFAGRHGFSYSFTGGENTVESAGNGFPGCRGFSRSFADGKDTADDTGFSFSLRITHSDAKAQEALAFPPYLCRQRHPDAEAGGEGDSGGKG